MKQIALLIILLFPVFAYTQEKEKEIKLKEVAVKAKQKAVIYKSDRMIYNVENSVTAIGGNAVSAITAAPGIVLKNNTISILGKGATRVMVDGKMIELTGEDLINYLNSISAGEIKSVEVITNPPAKYEAGGDGGLINIILKKSLQDSWKNSTVMAYEQDKYNALTIRNNFLYSRNKVKLSLSGGITKGNTGVKQDLDTYYPNGLWALRYEGKQKKDNGSGRAALDYDLSKKTTIGVQYLGNHTNRGSQDDTKNNIFNVKNTLDSVLINMGNREMTASSHTFNAHIVSNLDTMNRKISFDADYFTYNSTTDNNFTANTFLPDGAFLNNNLSAQNISNQAIHNFSTKVDMEHPLKFANLSYGAKLSFINSRGDIGFFNTATGVSVVDNRRSNEFSYQEKNQAVYFSGSKNINNKLSIQLGLRLENTQTEGYSRTLDQTNKMSYLKLFPTLYATYKANENNSFLLNYGKRINRPGFSVLNPFRSYLSSNSYSEGNPFLKPSFSDNIDLTYTYKGKLRSNAFLNITTDGFSTVFTSNPVNSTLVVSRQNYFKEFYYGLGENYTVDVNHWWSAQALAYLLASKSEFTNTINATPKNGVQLYMSTNNTFSLGGSTKLQADYYYSSAYNRGLYTYGATSGLNIGLKQSLLNKNMQLSILVNDVFNTGYLKDYTSVVNGIKQVYNENNSSRYFRISLTYNFGNAGIKVKERDFGNDDERKRSN